MELIISNQRKQHAESKAVAAKRTGPVSFRVIICYLFSCLWIQCRFLLCTVLLTRWPCVALLKVFLYVCFSCKQERTAVTNYCSCQAPEPIDLKLYTCDYVAHLTPHAIGSNKRPMGLFPNMGEMSPSPTILLLLSLLFDDLLFYYQLQYLCPETTLLG